MEVTLAYAQTLERCVINLCSLLTALASNHRIQPANDIVSERFPPLRDLSAQLRYQQRIEPRKATADIVGALQRLPKIKRNDYQGKRNDYQGKRNDYQGKRNDFQMRRNEIQMSDLEPINELPPDDKATSRYIRGKSQKQRKSAGTERNNGSYNGDYEVIRQETQRSLENPYHSENPHRKTLYKELERSRGQDTIMPAVKQYLDSRRKNANQPKTKGYMINQFL